MFIIENLFDFLEEDRKKVDDILELKKILKEELNHNFFTNYNFITKSKKDIEDDIEDEVD